MPEPVRVFDVNKGILTRKDTILPPGSTVHSPRSKDGTLSPHIAYTYISGRGRLTVGVQGPFVVGRCAGTTSVAYFLWHPNGGK